MDKNRNISLDLIRSVAIIFVILQHCWSMLGYSSELGWRSYTCRYGQIGVALFVMVSGALLLPKTQPIGEFLKKRLPRVLIPFGIIGTCVYVLSALLHRYADIHSWSDAVSCYFPYLFENKINEAYWYIFLIIGLYLVTPFLQRALHTMDEPENKRLLRFGLFLWFCLSIMETIYPQCKFFKLYSFGADDFIGYFLAGYYSVHYFTNKGQYKWWFFTGALVTCILNFVLVSQQIRLPIILIVETLCIFLFLSSITSCNSFISKGVILVSRYSYTIYLCHFVLVSALIALGANGLPKVAAPTILGIVTLMLTTLLCFCIDKCKFINNKLVGIN